MKRALLLALGALAIPSAAQAVYVSPEKQDELKDHPGWSVSDSLSVVPVPTEAGDGRNCERALNRTAVRDSDQSPMSKVWAQQMTCERNNRCVELHSWHGQGSSGRGWERKSPMSYPWVRSGWLDRYWLYRTRTEVLFEYGSFNTPWNLTANVQANCAVQGDSIRWKREGSVR